MKIIYPLTGKGSPMILRRNLSRFCTILQAYTKITKIITIKSIFGIFQNFEPKTQTNFHQSLISKNNPKIPKIKQNIKFGSQTMKF